MTKNDKIINGFYYHRGSVLTGAEFETSPGGSRSGCVGVLAGKPGRVRHALKPKAGWFPSFSASIPLFSFWGNICKKKQWENMSKNGSLRENAVPQSVSTLESFFSGLAVG